MRSSLGVLLCLPLSLAADQLRFDTVQDLQQWKVPLGAVELIREGQIQLVPVRQDIDAVLDARRFAGQQTTPGEFCP